MLSQHGHIHTLQIVIITNIMICNIFPYPGPILQAEDDDCHVSSFAWSVPQIVLFLIVATITKKASKEYGVKKKREESFKMATKFFHIGR